MMVLKWFNKLKQSKTMILKSNYVLNDYLVEAPPNSKLQSITGP